jgi:hypothetical protein
MATLVAAIQSALSHFFASIAKLMELTPSLLDYVGAAYTGE